MKNKKGFTLVELLAVIIILSILVIIAVPNISGALNAAKNKLSDVEKKHIEDASERVILEVLNCDLWTNMAGETDYRTMFGLSENTSINCKELQEAVISKNIEIDIDNLRNYGYLTDINNTCSGKVKVYTSESYQINVDTSNIVCKK